MKDALYNVFDALMSDVRNGIYHPDMVTDNGVPAEFAAVKLSMYDNHIEYNSISRLIIDYYRQKEIATRIHQKSVDIRRIVTTHLERAYKKLDIQEKQIKDTEKKDKYRIYGELLTTYAYSIPAGSMKHLITTIILQLRFRLITLSHQLRMPTNILQDITSLKEPMKPESVLFKRLLKK